MGPCSSKSKAASDPQSNPQQPKNEDNKPCIFCWSLSAQTQDEGGLVITNAKQGRITKDYTLLNPPLGKGITLNPKIGAYGEVRKAIHKQSGMMRAVKIIGKAQTNKEEQERLMNEVAILQRLVW
jgi:calcium-dependent protein kinase